jgi:hypothetical protein
VVNRLLIIAFAASCSGSGTTSTPEPAAPVTNTTVNAFYERGAPTFIVGTAGDETSDRAIAAQVDLIRGLAFPKAPVMKDGDVSEWPEAPVVYGGPHVNALMAEIAGTLPFELTAGRLVLGDRTFEGDEFQLITVVPADGDRPELLLYAGTGTPGVGEINGVSHGPSPILVADAFGPLVTGRWKRSDDGEVTAVLDPPARRIKWRDVARDHVTFRFPASLPAGSTRACEASRQRSPSCTSMRPRTSRSTCTRTAAANGASRATTATATPWSPSARST